MVVGGIIVVCCLLGETLYVCTILVNFYHWKNRVNFHEKYSVRVLYIVEYNYYTYEFKINHILLRHEQET